MILVRSAVMLATIKMLILEGHFHFAQGVAERVLAVILLIYLNTAGARAWFVQR